MSWNCFSTKLRLRTMVSAFALLATAGGAGTVQGATLEEAIAAALVNNPDVGVVRADRRAVQQELRQARALWLPSVDVTAATGPEYTDNEFRNEDLMTWESRIALRQLLFDGFATQAEVDRQLARVDSSARRVRESSEAVALDAVEAYLDVIRQQAIVREAQINIDNHSRILGFTRDLANQGRGGISDVRQVESRLATAQATFAQANGDLADAKARFQRVVGIPIGETEIPEPPEGALPLDAEQAAALAREASPTVEILRSDLDVARANLRASRSGYYPEFTAEVGASANHNIDGVRGRDNDAQALLRMNYNLFRGGGDVAREREAFARVEEAKFALEQAQRDSEEQARLAFNALTTASNETVALRDGVTASRRTRDAYREEFQLGQRRLLDLLTAENELFLSRTNLVTSEIVEDFAVYQILANTGQLLETLEIDTAPESVNIFREPPAEIDEPLPGDDQIVSNDLQAPPGAEPVAVAAPAAIAAPLGTAEAPPVAEPARADASTPAAPAASAGDESEYDSFGSFWAGLFGGAAAGKAAAAPESAKIETAEIAPAPVEPVVATEQPKGYVIETITVEAAPAPVETAEIAPAAAPVSADAPASAEPVVAVEQPKGYVIETITVAAPAPEPMPAVPAEAAPAIETAEIAAPAAPSVAAAQPKGYVIETITVEAAPAPAEPEVVEVVEQVEVAEIAPAAAAPTAATETKGDDYGSLQAFMDDMFGPEADSAAAGETALTQGRVPDATAVENAPRPTTSNPIQRFFGFN